MNRASLLNLFRSQARTARTACELNRGRVICLRVWTHKLWDPLAPLRALSPLGVECL
jgi:hypothetical protein